MKHLALSQVQRITLISGSPVSVTSKVFSAVEFAKLTETNSLELYSVEERIFLLLRVYTSNMQQTALSAFSAIARNFLEGLRAIAEILSDPSIP